jgi:glycosyltransferase involved in cell wall biosynthesis
MGYERDLRRLLGELGIEDRTLLTGLLPGRARLEALADADVVVYASKDEIFGLVPLEAILTGTPVVVADDSGCGEVVGTVGGGMVIGEGDVDALAAAVEQILDAPAKWRAVAADAQDGVRDLCSPDHVCARLEEVYREVIASNASASSRT